MNVTTKIYIILTILTVCVGILVSITVFKAASTSTYALLGQRQTVIAEQLLWTIDNILNERFSDITELSEDDATAKFVQSPNEKNTQDLRGHFVKKMQHIGQWNRIELVDPSTKVRISTDTNRDGMFLDGETLEVYNKAMSGEATHSDVLVLPSGERTILFASPVRNTTTVGKQVESVVMGYFSWPVIDEILSKSDIKYSYLLDNRGSVISSYIHLKKENEQARTSFSPEFVREHLNNTSGYLVTKDALGNEFLTGFMHQAGYLSFRGNNWVFVLETPMNVVTGASRNTVIRILLPLFLALSLGTFAILLSVQFYVLKPIHNLSQTVSHITQGDLSARANVHSTDEMGKLAQALNDMTKRLKDLHNSLEEKVKERTLEIEKKSKESEQKSREYEEMNKLMVGRELKMAELKKQIEALKHTKTTII